MYDVAIIGSGVVGLSGGLYAGRLGLKTIVIGKEKGGTITKTHIVENYPGFKSITGRELAENILEHMNQYKENVGLIEKEVSDVKINGNCFELFLNGEKVKARSLLIATGSRTRKLGVKGEEEFTNKGVHYCALCDGIFYKDKVVAVVGGGDAAAKEALLLSKYAEKVYVLARSTLKAEPVNSERVKSHKKINVIEDVEVKEIVGEKSVKSVVLTKRVGASKNLKLDGVFVSIGHVPLSELASKLKVRRNKHGEIKINKESQTNVAMVYAAGDVTDTKFKQAITGVGEAVKAIYNIYEDLKNERFKFSCCHEE